ncbi:MAG: hypothetical protein HKN95_07740 [Acidimicrobiia bacterium]|nr:hypothetical protein [Acidimicrobiia bacterium]
MAASFTDSHSRIVAEAGGAKRLGTSADFAQLAISIFENPMMGAGPSGSMPGLGGDRRC